LALHRAKRIGYESVMPKPWWREPTRAQWCTFIAAWLGWVLDAFDAMIYILVAGDIAAEFGVSKVAVMGSLTLTLMVRLLGGGIAGWMADRWGRKLPLMISLLWLAAFDASIYFAPTFAAVLVLRTIFGLGMGAEWTAGTAMAMENWPASSRKIASGVLQAGWPIGFLLAAAAAAWVVPAWGWRALFLFAAVPALLVLPIRYFVKDTHVRVARVEDRPRLAELFAPGVLRMIVLGSVVMALGFIVYYGLTANYMLVLVEQGVAPRDAYFHLIVFNLGMLAGVVLAGAVANRRGVIVAIIAPALLMLPALPLYVGVAPGWSWLGAVLGGALGAGYSGVTPALITQIFDDRVRARAIGFVYHAGALIAAFVPTAIPYLSAHSQLSLAGAAAVVVGAGLIGLAGTVYVLRRTITTPAGAAVSPAACDARPASPARRPAASPA
jgi:SHS family lactate transporter-like MFS transporter